MMKDCSKMTQEELERDNLVKLIKLSLRSPMKNLVVTCSPSIEKDNLLSGDMDKYYFDNATKVELSDYNYNKKLILTEENTNESLRFDVSKINEISPISKNDSLVFPQENVCAMKYDGEQIVTFYFD